MGRGCIAAWLNGRPELLAKFQLRRKSQQAKLSAHSEKLDRSDQWVQCREVSRASLSRSLELEAAFFVNPLVGRLGVLRLSMASCHPETPSLAGFGEFSGHPASLSEDAEAQGWNWSHVGSDVSDGQHGGASCVFGV